MERKDVLLDVQSIFKTVFDNETINLTEKSTANDIDEWDSLTHIQLVVAIEKKFNIKFTSLEILTWNNIGEVVDSIMLKQKKC
ncbi:MAG: acyl carrier protein [Dysgonamonadaceae bacterium]|jgi:acyl carrier protein|nr:acyl carrier protein [Dysgonamonadaceae bacterium]